MVVLTFAIVLLTAGNVLVGFWYASITKQAAIDNGKQTDRLICAANIQAHAADIIAQSSEDFSDTARGIKDNTADAVAQFKRLAKGTETAIRTSQKSAQAALQASIDNLRLDERPWVLPSRFELSAEPEPDKPFTIKVNIQNTGKTPAVDLIPQSRLFSWNEEPPPTDFAEPKDKIISKGIIPPGGGGGNSFTTDPLILDAIKVGAYKGKSNRIYIHAYLNYKDGLSGSKLHWTRLCAYHTFGDKLDEFVYCKAGNEIDR